MKKRKLGKRTNIRLFPKGDRNKYLPHQGEQEKARRRKRQLSKE